MRFVGAQGKFNSIATQGVRINKGLQAIPGSVIKSDLRLLPRDAFQIRGVRSAFRRFIWQQLVKDVDILVVVKASLFYEFEDAVPQFAALCREEGVVLVSSPADGVEARGLDKVDTFSERYADYVLTGSGVQHALFESRRSPETVLYVGNSTRPDAAADFEVRERVRTVVWENPPHHDPYSKPELSGLPRNEHQAFELHVAAFCEARGARLQILNAWRDEQDDRDWQRTLLAADIAIECKSLGRRYTSYQLQKPAVKLQNYLALGLPTVCDSLPSQVDVGMAAGVIFADTLDEWDRSLELLFESRALRAEMSHAGRKAVKAASIEAVAERYATFFSEMQAIGVAR